MKKIKFNWKMILISVICLGLIAVGIIALKNYNLFSTKKTAVSSNRYLTANYALMMYESSTSYIPQNVNLDSLRVNENIKFTDDDLFDNVDEQYRECSGTVLITKNKYNIYEHKIMTSCENAAENNVNLTLKVYTNINQNSNYQIITDFNETNAGFSGVLSNYNVDISDNITSWRYNGVSGIIDFNKELDISSINLLENNIEGMGTDLIKLSNGYLLQYDLDDNSNSNDYEIIYYNNDFKKMWSKINGNFYIQSILYETEDNIIFNNIECEWENDVCNSVGKIYELNKTDGNITYKFTLQKDKNAVIWVASYNDEIIYGYDPNDPKMIYVYDLNGKVIRIIDTKEYYVNNEHFMPRIVMSKNIMLLANNGIVYVVDKNDKLVNTIEFDTSTFEIQLVVNEKYYEVLYPVGGYERKFSYSRYDLNNKLIFREYIVSDYGYSTLEKLGLPSYNDGMGLFEPYTFITNGKVIEKMYYPDNNGTLLMMMFDYDDSTNIESYEVVDD